LPYRAHYIITNGRKAFSNGQSNEATATRLFVSRKTVRNHVSNIFNKLQVVGRAEAIIRARDAGMG